MAYSTSPFTLMKMETQLYPLSQGKTVRWARPLNEKIGWASAWAYKVREAFYIARLYPDRFPALAKIADKVKVSVLEGGGVEARVEIAVHPAPVAVVTAVAPTIAQVEDAPVADMNTIMSAIEREEELGATVHFPRTSVSAEELKVIAGQAQANKQMVLYSARTTGLTIAPDDPEVPAEARVQP